MVPYTGGANKDAEATRRGTKLRASQTLAQNYYITIKKAEILFCFSFTSHLENMGYLICYIFMHAADCPMELLRICIAVSHHHIRTEYCPISELLIPELISELVIPLAL